MQADDKSLEEAYKATRYEVSLPEGTATIRIGRVCKKLEETCIRHSVKSWAFITAYNPLSRLLSDAENRHRQQVLESLLNVGKYQFYIGEGVGESNDWPSESSFLVLGIDQQKALAYGRVFDQYAIVYGDSGSVAQLLFCIPR